MRTRIRKAMFLAVMAGWCGTASATLIYDYSGSAAAILDNNGSGSAFPFSFSGSATPIDIITVTLNISGGWNGDLYVYLSHGSGFAVLLNRVGRTSGNSLGYADRGFDVTFSHTALNGDIHNYQSITTPSTGSPLTGIWAPDARNVDPASVLDTSLRSAFLSSFTGLDPNGDWTLFVADVSQGSLSTLNDFTVNIEPVPEPINAALAIFASVVAGGCALRSRWFAGVLLRGKTRSRR